MDPHVNAWAEGIRIYLDVTFVASVPLMFLYMRSKNTLANNVFGAVWAFNFGMGLLRLLTAKGWG